MVEQVIVSAAFTFAPAGVIAVAVFIAAWITEPARIFAEGEATQRALRTEIDGLLEDPEAEPLVRVEGIQEMGPVVRVTALVGVERMRVRVCDWDTEVVDPTRICYLEWPGGSTEIDLAEGDPVLLSLGTREHKVLHIKKCVKLWGRGHAREHDVEWHHDLCLSFTAMGHRNQRVWVRDVNIWSVHEEGHYTANATTVLARDYEPEREHGVGWRELVSQVQARIAERRAIGPT
jgi:hypothetical protein